MCVWYLVTKLKIRLKTIVHREGLIKFSGAIARMSKRQIPYGNDNTRSTADERHSFVQRFLDSV